ncbi:glycosyltransferase [Tichowtungia aerotolerans]|uniref:NDP-sugar synthase n=1 Tax=Tichowtungia aerotolerans TaxID=2697043 RepID=A0A6P1M6G9_9BACT|nr:NDP-sugar synthase [Tichowtungia aerotolerans]QHI68194.1 hypothetical protein GT409_01590 [Tichowtungia aerotolerans]
MRAVFYTGSRQPWAAVLGERPWALLPVGSRPLLTYWLELCVDLGITELQLILGQDAEHIELFCGNGEKWGLNINYSFIRPGDSPQEYLARDPARWRDGLLYLSGALFPRRLADFSSDRLKDLLPGACYTENGSPAFFVSDNPEMVDAFIRNGRCTCQSCLFPKQVGLDITLIHDISQYYDLNMTIVRSEMDRYLSSGYSFSDSAAIGYNVITPPSVSFNPPLAIGNDCRLGAICSVGPDVVISDHVLIDRQSELSESIILSDTYVGRNLEINGKIVAGNRIIDPADGSFVDIEDPWLVAHTQSKNYMRDFLRTVFGWECALFLVLIQLVPFILLYTVLRLRRLGVFIKKPVWGIGGKRIVTSCFVATDVVPSVLLMIFYGASLDRFPQLLSVLSGKLWLCGQVPKACGSDGFNEGNRYFPAVFTHSDAFAEIDRQMDALYYAHTRSLVTDLRILRQALFSRLLEVEVIAGIISDPV